MGKFSVSAPQQSNPPEVPEAVEVPEAARLEHQREIENAAEREQALRQALWESQLETYFEITYRVIFASQMRVLKLLNESPTGFRQDALRLLAPAAITASGAALERWSQYFLTSSLAVVQDQNIVISEPGRNFLLYVTRQGYPELGPNTQW